MPPQSYRHHLSRLLLPAESDCIRSQQRGAVDPRLDFPTEDGLDHCGDEEGHKVVPG